MSQPAFLPPLPPTSSTGSAIPKVAKLTDIVNTANTVLPVLAWRVWFADGSAVLLDATTEGEARMQAEGIARRNGHAPHEVSGRVSRVEVLP